MMSGGNKNHIRLYSVLRGGIAIHNPLSDPNVPGGAYGTLGIVGTRDGTDRWLVSCYHVLCRKQADMPPAVTEPVFHPFSQLHPSPVAFASAENANRDLDCAAARLISVDAIGDILGIGRLRAPIPPTIGMRVIKSGAETGVTEGRIIGIADEDIEIGPLALPADYELSEGGDSGSVWVDAETMGPVGLHYRGSDRGMPERAYAKPFNSVLEALKLKLLF